MNKIKPVLFCGSLHRDVRCEEFDIYGERSRAAIITQFRQACRRSREEPPV